jgi:hypothetical protein
MLSQAIGDLLPAAAAVALSPIPIIAIVVVLDSRRARVNGSAFAVGWVAGLAGVSVAVVRLTGGASDPHSDSAAGVNWLMVAVGAMLLVMAARQRKKRPERGEDEVMPAWMAGVESVSPVEAAGLGGADQAIAIAKFAVIGSVTIVGAVSFFLVAPSRAARPLGVVRQFMADNNATIMMVIVLILGFKVLGNALSGFGS